MWFPLVSVSEAAIPFHLTCCRQAFPCLLPFPPIFSLMHSSLDASNWAARRPHSHRSDLLPCVTLLLFWKFDWTPWQGGGLLAGCCSDVKVPDSVAFSFPSNRKLAKKRKDAIGTTRQEMTHMVNAMDRSYADQSTLHGEDPMAVTFMDSHNYNNRCKLHFCSFYPKFRCALRGTMELEWWKK